MSKFFVTGPIGMDGLGLARRCVVCRARAGHHTATCTGFGAGCLTRPAPEEDDKAPADEETAKRAARKK